MEPPKITKPKPVAKIRFPRANVVKRVVDAKPANGKITLTVKLNWPPGWKTNDLAKMGYFLYFENKSGIIDRSRVSLDKIDLPKPTNQFSIELPVTGNGSDKVRIEVPYYYCETGNSGLCKYGQVAFDVTLGVGPDRAGPIVLTYDVPE